MPFDKIMHYIMGLSVVCLLLTLVAIGAQADDSTPPQPEAVVNKVSMSAADPVQDLISGQLYAIRARNADLAYSYTTDSFHQKYDNSKDFLNTLRFQLRPIYNNADFRFLSQSRTDKGIIQRVAIDQKNGDEVTVIYRIREQDGGTFLIDSFAVLGDESDPI